MGTQYIDVFPNDANAGMGVVKTSTGYYPTFGSLEGPPLGFQSNVFFNVNPNTLNFLNGTTINFPGDLVDSQTTEFLHELGHMAGNAGLPTAVQNDSVKQLGQALGNSTSDQNNMAIGAACFPLLQDSGPDQGVINDGSGPVNAVTRARKHF